MIPHFQAPDTPQSPLQSPTRRRTVWLEGLPCGEISVLTRMSPTRRRTVWLEAR